MTTKDYLNQISRLNRMINNKLVELAQLKELSCSISSIKNEERVMTTPNFDRIGTKQAKIDEIYAALTNKADLISALVDCYSETLEGLLAEPEEGKGNAVAWTTTE